MIKLIESQNDIIASEENLFGCKILSIAHAYGVGEPFSQFWVQDGGPCIAKLDDTIILDTGSADWKELGEFLRMLDIKNVLCPEEVAERLELPISGRGEIMCLRGASENLYPTDVEQNPGLREIYALLCAAQSETFVPPEFEPFYMDMSYRTRHGAAMSVGIRQGEELVACALCSSITEHAAVISAVAVLPQYRKKGLGRSAVTALISMLNREAVYLMRADGENEEFYRSLGFVPEGRWAQIQL
ncbi:MAG: N-acetyltransferase domain-containing protein [Oscillospiraceae bacterium]|jgi:GNAT superfamily N-acetyltransferase